MYEASIEFILNESPSRESFEISRRYYDDSDDDEDDDDSDDDDDDDDDDNDDDLDLDLNILTCCPLRLHAYRTLFHLVDGTHGQTISWE